MPDPRLTFLLAGKLTRSTQTDRSRVAEARWATGANRDVVLEIDVPPSSGVDVDMSALGAGEAEFIFVQALGGDLSVSITPKSGTATVLRADNGLIVSGTSAVVTRVSSVSGCHALVVGAAK
jgi:hypothetical protein